MQPRSELDASPAAPVTTLLASLGLTSFDSPFHRSSLSIQLTYSSICISIYHRQNEARLRCSRVDIWCFIGGAKLSGNWHQLKQKIQPSSRNKPELSAPSSFILQTNIFKCLDQIIAIQFHALVQIKFYWHRNHLSTCRAVRKISQVRTNTSKYTNTDTDRQLVFYIPFNFNKTSVVLSSSGSHFKCRNLGLEKRYVLFSFKF